MTSRLAIHLTVSGTMRWNRGNGVYSCDLGFEGGAFYPVGSADAIWTGAATLTTETLSLARSAHLAGQAQRNPRRQFVLADTNWQNWTPR
jgi:hypothetical protein